MAIETAHRNARRLSMNVAFGWARTRHGTQDKRKRRPSSARAAFIVKHWEEGM